MISDEEKLRNTTDPRTWADHFCRAYRIHAVDGTACDEVALMNTWFANAIETGRSNATNNTNKGKGE